MQRLLLAGVKHSHARKNHREGRTATLLSADVVPVSQMHELLYGTETEHIAEKTQAKIGFFSNYSLPLF